VFDLGSFVGETFRCGASAFELGTQMRLSDDPEIARLDCAALFLHLTEKRPHANSLAIRVEFGERDPRGAYCLANSFRLGGPAKPPELAHEIRDRAAGYTVILGIGEITGNSRASRHSSYQCELVGSDGRHLRQAESVAETVHWTGSRPSRSHFRVKVKWGLTQV
jgi:hypothetical protein